MRKNTTIKDKFKLRTFVRIAMLTALACILTMFPQIPTGTGGYVHFGDSIIYVSSIFLGPLAGAIVGALGHSMADILSGYVIFAPLTFLVKGIMGYVIGKILYNHICKTRFIIAAIVSLAIVTLGYFFGEIPLFGVVTASAVFISSPIQWLMSVIASSIFVPIIHKYKAHLHLN